MIPLHALPDRVYLVLGLGRSGLAAAKALLAAGRTVWAWDDAAAVRAAAAAAGVPLVDLQGCELPESASLILSPGIPHTFPAPHPLVERVRRAGIEIIGDVELLCRAVPGARCIGVTGTNGKSTTTALIGHILTSAGLDRRIGGNLGAPVLGFPPPTPTTIFVLEMSSYQLELTPSLVFNAAVLINISPDHLSRHGGMEGYIAAKRRIFDGGGRDDVAVIGVDDPHCRALCTEVARRNTRRVVVVSGRRRVGGGVYVEDSLLWDAIEGDGKAMLDLKAARALPGEHNAQNAAAAYAVTRRLGIGQDVIAEAILGFPGLAHRQQKIATIRGVTYVNDSKATNAEAAARALASYTSVYWIAGGRPKEDGLAAALPWLDRVRQAYLIGEAEDAFAQALDGKVPVVRCGTLQRAVAAARAAAEQEGKGAVVLLSPACASFDQFADFEARGDAFRALVEAIN